jgi:hypothetical protein
LLTSIVQSNLCHLVKKGLRAVSRTSQPPRNIHLIELQECMEQPEHREYYAPMLEEEAEYVREQTALQQEAEAAAVEQADTQSGERSAGSDANTR